MTKASLLLKHSGINEDQAVQIIQQHISLIPGHKESKNCKEYKTIIRNIYARYQDLFAIKPGCAPKWLVSCLVIPNAVEGSPTTKKLATSSTEVAKRNKGSSKDEGTESPISQMQIFLKKGGKPPAPVLRKVSRDQCFTFEKNYYSLPKTYVGKQVLIFPWEGKIRVYDAQTEKHIHTHSMTSNAKGKYLADPEHIGIFGDLEQPYYSMLVKHFQAKGDAIGTFAQNLVNRYKLFSLRRLWILRASINKYGSNAVEQIAPYSRNLRDLSNNLKIYVKGHSSHDPRSQGLPKAILSS